MIIPSCYGSYDDRDIMCEQCIVRDGCVSEQTKIIFEIGDDMV